MPAVFQIVSRASGKALSAVGLPDPSIVTQLPASDENPTQRWTLEPTDDSAEDFVIRSFISPALAIGLDPTDAVRLYAGPAEAAQVWRISRIANPPFFFLLEGSNDLLMDVPHGSHADNLAIQVFRRNEHANQQWVFLPVLAELP
jgi:hypothetical protein